MSEARANYERFRVSGEGTCVGGKHPDVPIDAFPLLAWTENHPRFGYRVVHTEDGRASVEQVALAIVKTPALDSVATEFGTTVDHVAQAIDYAVAAGYLGKGA